mgnify:FL=1
MDANLAKKIDLLAQNYITVSKSGKLEFGQAACLGALMFTQNDAVADEAKIRACRKILKGRVSILSNFRGCTNLALLCRMALQEDPEAYLDDVMCAYKALSAKKTFRSETLVFAAEAMTEGVEEDRYAQVAEDSWAVIEKMKSNHPLLTSQSDATLAAMLVMSGLDVDAVLSEAEEIYERMKGTGFKLHKNALYSISIILALSDKPVEEKCQRFTELRNALKVAGHRIWANELPVLAAFVNIDAPNETIVEQICATDSVLSKKKGFTNLLGCGAEMRRLFAAALVLQAHEEDKFGPATSQSSALASVIVEQVIMTIILIIVVTSVSVSSSSH